MDRGEGGRGGTLIRDGELFPGRVFPRKQEPLLGTLIRDGQLFSRSCFSQKTKAPARNADPRRIACVSHLSSRRHGRGKKMFALLGPNCHPGGQICCGADFGSRNKISGHPLGQSASFFEIYPFRLVLEPKSPSCYGPWPCPASWSNGHAGCYGEPARAITDGTVAAGTGSLDFLVAP